tara:strand:+ start:8911 stop:9018 length:108 start_codon:yes stop_codon:yes gene_type:complete
MIPHILTAMTLSAMVILCALPFVGIIALIKRRKRS